MYLTPIQTLTLIVCIAIGTMLTRFLPFLVFPEHKEVPSYVVYLGKVLPCAVIGLLVVYCLKNTPLSLAGMAELISVALTVLLHLWKKSTLLSIAGGTLVYMFLIQQVFIT